MAAKKKIKIKLDITHFILDKNETMQMNKSAKGNVTKKKRNKRKKDYENTALQLLNKRQSNVPLHLLLQCLTRFFSQNKYLV